MESQVMQITPGIILSVVSALGIIICSLVTLIYKQTISLMGSIKTTVDDTSTSFEAYKLDHSARLQKLELLREIEASMVKQLAERLENHEDSCNEELNKLRKQK